MNLTKKGNINKKPPKTDILAAIILGFGLIFAIIPILLSSLIVKENLLVVFFDKMDSFWRSRGWE